MTVQMIHATLRADVQARIAAAPADHPERQYPVSYTHLTLPTIYSV